MAGKDLPVFLAERRAMIELGHGAISTWRQREVLAMAAQEPQVTRLAAACYDA